MSTADDVNAGPDASPVDVVDVEVTATKAQPARLSVRRWAGAGQPFLLVHGLSSNARLWDEVAARLADAGHPVAAVDLRSHGESSAPADGYDTGTAASDAAGVAAAVFPGRPVIAVGQSWGGQVVVRLAARYPDRVAAIGLVDGGWLDPSGAYADWSTCVAALRPPDVDGVPTDTLRRWITAEHPDWSPTAVAATLANLRERPDGTRERRLSIDNHLRILRSMWDEPPWPDLATITVPALLLPAIATAAIRAAEQRALVARAMALLADAEVREYVGGDHDLHAQHPAAVAADLLTLAVRARGGGVDGGTAGHHGVGGDHSDHGQDTSSNI